MGARSKVRTTLLVFLFLSSTLLFPAGPVARADEGMWTFDNPPLKQLKEKYGFIPTQQWLDHVRLSSVRIGDGGSGSFVSPNGLVLTNHHVARGQLQKVSSPQKDYVKDGFYAKTYDEELKCPDLEINVLISMENVTARVQGAVKAGMNDEQALQARKAEITKIEDESLKATGLRSDVISFYQSSEYWLYCYKKYTDIRLVFAPEQQIAFYGGDPDNFTYPRYDLDMALFRVYENGKPLQTKDYLKWNKNGAGDGELVFVSGNPGSTNRLQTYSQLEMQRDYSYPLRIKSVKRMLEVLRKYSAIGPEQRRQAAGQIFGLENALKAWDGEYQGLLDKNLMAKREKEEKEFRALVASKPEWEKEYGGAWDAIAQAEKKQLDVINIYRYRGLRGSRLAGLALTIIQYVAEVKKPDAKRLDGFHDSQLESLKFRLFSPAPIYPQLEEMMMADGLQESLEGLGPDDSFIKIALDGETPAEAAKELIGGTKLADPAFRKSLVDGGETAVEASTDPLVVYARKYDPMARDARKWMEDNIASVETAAGGKIGKARFVAYGKTLPPDATFTLRLSYGAVKGYPLNGTKAPYKTTFYGLYDRWLGFDQKPPFNLPSRYVERKDKLDLSMPLDFVSTCDIIGGNSGSPVINKEGELVGLIFDGNIESLVGRFVYDETSNRAVSVHSGAMIYALRNLYDAGALADELEGSAGTK